MLSFKALRRLCRLFSRVEELLAVEEPFACNPLGQMGQVAQRARGVRVQDVRGREYFDCSGGEGAGLFSHLRQDFVRAFSAAFEAGGSCVGAHPLYHSNCTRIARLCGAQQALILPSEGHLVDLVIDLVDDWAHKTKHTPRGKSWVSLSRQGSSGCSLQSCAVSDDFRTRVGFGPFPLNAETIDADSLQALERNLAANDHIAAFFLNPLPLRAGMRPPRAEYMQRVRAICDAYQVLLVLDERGCGSGRTGSFGYFQQFGLSPDLVMLGGGLAGGFAPMGVLAGKEALLAGLTPRTSDPAVMAVVDAALGVLEDARFMSEVERKGALLLQLLREGLSWLKMVCDVRRIGLMLCVQIWPFVAVNELDLTVRLARRGLLVSSVSKHIYIFPPLDVGFDECADIAAAVKEAFEEYY